VWSWNPADGPWKKEYGGPKEGVFLEVSCKMIRLREAYDFWREVAFQNFEPAARERSSKAVFHAEAQAFITPRAEIYTYRSDEISGRRSRRQAMAAGDNITIDIGLILSGVRHYESTHTSAPVYEVSSTGSFFTYDPTHPCKIQWQAHHRLKQRRRDRRFRPR